MKGETTTRLFRQICMCVYVYDSVQARQVDYDVAACRGVQAEHEQYMWLSSA